MLSTLISCPIFGDNYSVMIWNWVTARMRTVEHTFFSFLQATFLRFIAFIYWYSIGAEKILFPFPFPLAAASG
jgi:hypothetical protein